MALDTNMDLAALESALWAARRRVFSDDPAVEAEAAAEITRLRKLIEKHPKEVKRRETLRVNADIAFMRRWE